MNIETETKIIMNEYGIHPNKKLGQNFLINENVLQTISKEANVGDNIIEIGPGLGTLTRFLLEKAKKVYAVELDPKMCIVLKSRFNGNDKFRLVNEDILKLDISRISNNAKVIANLPYYITTSIITKLLQEDIKEIVLLIQKEVADRICANPGEKDAGAITYFVNYYANAKKILNVPKECFIPSPKVESEVIKLTKLKEPRVKVKNEKLLFELIKENFSKRRKTILNSLSNTINKEKLKNALEKLKIPENTRGETLTLEQYAKLTNEIEPLTK